MDIQLDQMRSKNAKKVAHSKSNVKMGNFMDTVNNTDGIYGDKDKKKGDGKPKMSKKGGITFVHDGDTKYLHGGDYTTKGGFNFSGENTSPVVKGLKPYVTLLEDASDRKAGEKIFIKDISETEAYKNL